MPAPGRISTLPTILGCSSCGQRPVRNERPTTAETYGKVSPGAARSDIHARPRVTGQRSKTHQCRRDARVAHQEAAVRGTRYPHGRRSVCGIHSEVGAWTAYAARSIGTGDTAAAVVVGVVGVVGAGAAAVADHGRPTKLRLARRVRAEGRGGVPIPEYVAGAGIDKMAGAVLGWATTSHWQSAGASDRHGVWCDVAASKARRWLRNL